MRPPASRAPAHPQSIQWPRKRLTEHESFRRERGDVVPRRIPAVPSRVGWVLCCGYGVSRWVQISSPNQSKTNLESMTIWCWSVLGPLWVAGRAEDGFKMPAWESVVDILNISNAKGGGAFLECPETKMAPKATRGGKIGTRTL